MQALTVILSIVVMLLILSVLVSIHEAGHLAMAKLFKVYCFEYSIGFGPKFVHVKRRGGETYFSIGVLPFGGYVAMYGGGDEVPEGMEVPPPERSLEGIAKWKKVLVLIAGVTLNFILGLILIFISCSAFPQYYSAYQAKVTYSDGSTAATYVVKPEYTGATLSYIESHKEAEYEAKDYVLSMPYLYPYGGYLVADDVILYNADGTYFQGSEKETRYLALYYPSSVLENTGLEKSLRLYPATKDAQGNYITPPDAQQKLGINYVCAADTTDGANSYLNLKGLPDGTYAQMKMRFVPVSKDLSYSDAYLNHKIYGDPIKLEIKSEAYQSFGVTLPVIKEWNNFGEAWQDWANKVPQACTMIVQGFASLFTPGGWKNVSGIIGMTAAVPQIFGSGGVARVIWFAGVISINLAFFNLLPFPGLDGWALLVTVVEGVSKKKIPDKVKNIVSMVGLFLLFALMILIVIKDIIGLF